jgi:uncharacterized membrane protein YphA (DoxX/SURF4 family)
MTPPPQTLALALIMMRVTLGIFFLQWGIEKFVVPATTTGIFRNFYGLTVDGVVPSLLGGAQILLSLALIAGFVPRVTYGLVAVLHTVTVLVTIPRLLNPWNPVSNHFFIAGVPILAAFYALYLLRDADLYTVPRMMRAGPLRA